MSTPQNQSIQRAFDLLRALRHMPEGTANAQELAKKTGLSHPTAHRQLASLEAQGAVHRRSNGRYCLGLALVDFGQHVDAHDLYAELSAKPLRLLARHFQATAHLGILRHDMVTYLVKEGRQRKTLPIPTETNTELEAYCSAIGKSLLAYLPKQQREHYLSEGPFVPLTPQTITSADRLKRELTKIRRQGFAIDDEEVMEGLVCYAVPIFNRQNHAAAAISLSGQSEFMRKRTQKTEIVKALKHLAEDLSKRFFPQG